MGGDFDDLAVLSIFVSFIGDIETIEMKCFCNDTLVQHVTYDIQAR